MILLRVEKNHSPPLRVTIIHLKKMIMRMLIHAAIIVQQVDSFINVGVQQHQQQVFQKPLLSLVVPLENNCQMVQTPPQQPPLRLVRRFCRCRYPCSRHFNSPSNDDNDVSNNDAKVDVMADNTSTTASTNGTSTSDAITTVGSTKYYQGFVTRSLNEEPVERVSGDAILEPTFKFVGFMTILIVGLTGAFLFSNGIIF